MNKALVQLYALIVVVLVTGLFSQTRMVSPFTSQFQTSLSFSYTAGAIATNVSANATSADVQDGNLNRGASPTIATDKEVTRVNTSATVHNMKSSSGGANRIFTDSGGSNERQEEIQEARRQSYLKYGAPIETPALNDSVPFEQFSHIIHYAQAGLGHRLLRSAAAAYLGRVEGMALRAYWSGTVFENNTKDLFSMLFEPFTRDDFKFVNSTNRTLKFTNEVGAAGIVSTKYTGGLEDNKGKCLCTNDEIRVQSDYFLSLRNKYTRRHLVQSFMTLNNYSDHTVFGVHIRAGNGERRHMKGRGVHHQPTLFVESFINNIRTKYPTPARPPLIFIATDERRYRTFIAEEVKRQGLAWPVVMVDQEFLAAGEGTMANGNKDVEMWHSMLQDSFLLSHSDVLISGTFSSFSQSLPMYLALERPDEERREQNTYCELIDHTKSQGKKVDGGWYNSTPVLKLYCYDRMMDWCCGSGAKNPHHRKMPKFVDWKHRPRGTGKEGIRDFKDCEFLSFENGCGSCSCAWNKPKKKTKGRR